MLGRDWSYASGLCVIWVASVATAKKSQKLSVHEVVDMKGGA